MTTDTIRQAAQLAFERYYWGRPGHAWATAGNAMQIRWELVAAHVLNAPTQFRAWDCHALYQQGHATACDWSDISTKTRDRWHAVHLVIRRVGDAAYAGRAA
jgi:hypothetical protein